MKSGICRSRRARAVAHHAAVLALLAGVWIAVSAIASVPARADIITNNCGAPIKSYTKAMTNDSFTTAHAGYVNVKYANADFNVPAGQTQCVTVRFSAAASCTTVNPTDHCYIRAKEATIVALDPPTVFTSDATVSSHSFEWTTRLSAGYHMIQIQASTNGNTFNLYNWSLTVDVAK